MSMPTRTDEKLDAVFSALADPSRRSILLRLAEGEATVGQVAAPLKMAPPSVSKHLKVLETAGLIGRRVEGRTHHLSLKPGALRTASDWLAHYRRFWEEGADRLSNLAAELEAAERRGHSTS